MIILLRYLNVWISPGVKVKISGIPHYVMISPEVKIVERWAGFGEGYLKRKVSENMLFHNKT